MSSIYLHIPFCVSKCHYCNFFSQATTRNKVVVLQSLVNEIELRSEYLSSKKISSIYFGGGTPSILNAAEIEMLLQTLYIYFDIDDNAEITLEANPEHLTKEYAEAIKQNGINRLSLGIQTFNEQALQYLGRKHDVPTAIKSINIAKHVFDNISLDLIFGIPVDSYRISDELNQISSFAPQHISAYALTVEENTALFKKIRSGTFTNISQDKQAYQFVEVMDTLRTKGYEHYEISNYCLPGYQSRHNSGYWNDTHYLGLGPSAHSYNGRSRQWNVSSVKEYCAMIEMGQDFYSKEELDEVTKFNEYVLTSIRTAHGISFLALKERFGESRYESVLPILIAQQSNGNIIVEEDRAYLTDQGKLFCDAISADLMDVS